MKQMRPTLALALTVSVLACDAQTPVQFEPALAVAEAPTKLASVTGSGHVPFGDGQRVFTFHARDQGDGTAEGSYRITLTDPSLFFSVDVTCMATEGNTAWVAGVISDSNAPFIQLGSISYFFAIDNGEGANAPADVVSNARINDVEGEDLLFCQDRPLLLPSFPITQGNVQVR